jgi:hydrogenase nickel incorporation protein HypA/HybF
MHEMGIAIQIAEIATASIPPDVQDVKIERVNLRIGKFAAVVPSSLKFCFDIVAKDTPLAGSELHIEEVPVVVSCRDCQEQWTIEEPAFQCQNCQGTSIDIVSGRELDIESIEIAEEDE